MWRASTAMALIYAAGCLLAITGCGGSAVSGGGTKPPPEKITLGSQFFTNYGQGSPLNNAFAIAGQGDFLLQSSGTGFASTDVVEWNGSPLTTVTSDSQDIFATVPASLIAQPGTVTLQVKDTATGVVSNTQSFGIASPAARTAGVVQLITVAQDGTSANDETLVPPAISATGRFVSFQDKATNLVSGPVSGKAEIYERDTCTGAPQGCVPSTIRITVTADGSAVNDHSRRSAVSDDGRYVAFDSQATNLLPNTEVCGIPMMCVFLRDTCIGAASCTPSTRVISVAMDGSASTGEVDSISPDGRYVAFDSPATNILAGDTYNSTAQQYLRDTCNGAPSGCKPSTIAISQSTSGEFGNSESYDASASTNERYIIFLSGATNFGIANPGGGLHLFLRDICIGASGCSASTTQEDMAPDGSAPNNATDNGQPPGISGDGSVIAFASAASNLVSANLAAHTNVYARTTCVTSPANCTPKATVVSLGNDGSIPNAGSNNVSISGNGRFIAFGSLASNLVPGDLNGPAATKDIFVRDTCYDAPTGCTPSTVRVSVAISQGIGTQANQVCDYPKMSADGHYVVFMSAATNFLAGAGNGHTMIYLAKTGF